VLSDAKKTIQQFTSVRTYLRGAAGMIPMKNLSWMKLKMLSSHGADNLGHEVMTVENLKLTARWTHDRRRSHQRYIGAWFDVDKRFHLETKALTSTSTFTRLLPADGRLDVYYIHHGSDGGEIAPSQSVT
jgi:hypothetical protein